MSVPKLRRLHRPISVSAVPVRPSIDIWRSCRFLGAMLRALGGQPGRSGRFLTCRTGANHCRLRSIGWERCGHGLTSGTGFFDDLLSLFGYPSGSGQSLINGSLRMRYCSANFSHKKPTWGMPHFGGVAVLVSAATARSSVLGNLKGDGRKKIRLTKKTNVRKRFGADPWEQPIPKRWKAAALRDIVFHERQGGVFCSGDGLSHVREPTGIG